MLKTLVLLVRTMQSVIRIVLVTFNLKSIHAGVNRYKFVYFGRSEYCELLSTFKGMCTDHSVIK